MIDSSFPQDVPIFQSNLLYTSKQGEHGEHVEHGEQKNLDNLDNFRNIDYPANNDNQQNQNQNSYSTNYNHLSDSVSNLIKCVHDELLQFQKNKNSKVNSREAVQPLILENANSKSRPLLKFQLFGPNMGGSEPQNIQPNPSQVAKNEDFVKRIHEYIQNAYYEGKNIIFFKQNQFDPSILSNLCSLGVFFIPPKSVPEKGAEFIEKIPHQNKINTNKEMHQHHQAISLKKHKSSLSDGKHKRKSGTKNRGYNTTLLQTIKDQKGVLTLINGEGNPIEKDLTHNCEELHDLLTKNGFAYSSITTYRKYFRYGLYQNLNKQGERFIINKYLDQRFVIFKKAVDILLDLAEKKDKKMMINDSSVHSLYMKVMNNENLLYEI